MEHPNEDDYEDNDCPQIEDVEEVPKNLSACLHSKAAAGPE